MPRIEQVDLLLLKDIAAEVMESDSFRPELRRNAQAIGADGKTVYHYFSRPATKAAILVAMLVAVELGFDPISAVSTVVGAELPKEPKKATGDDPATAAAIAAEGEAHKPDFATLKKTFQVPPAELERQAAAPHNADIADEEDTLIPPGKMAYKAPMEIQEAQSTENGPGPEGVPVRVDEPAPAAQPTPEPVKSKRVRNRPPAETPIQKALDKAEDLLDASLVKK